MFLLFVQRQIHDDFSDVRTTMPPVVPGVVKDASQMSPVSKLGRVSVSFIRTTETRSTAVTVMSSFTSHGLKVMIWRCLFVSEALPAEMLH